MFKRFRIRSFLKRLKILRAFLLVVSIKMRVCFLTKMTRLSGFEIAELLNPVFIDVPLKKEHSSKS